MATLKKVKYAMLYDDTIVDICFVTIPRRGWFVANVVPIIEFMKATIPASAREYDPATFHWQIDVKYWPGVKTTLHASGFMLELVRANSATGEIPNVHVPEDYAKNFYNDSTITTQAESKESIAMQLAALLGIHEDLAKLELSELKKKYRQKAREYHPDLNPSNSDKMSELNRLWSIFNASERVQ